MPDACFVLLNPDLEDTILSYTFGIKTSDAVRKVRPACEPPRPLTRSPPVRKRAGLITASLRSQFVAQFSTCYYYRGTYQMERPANRPIERGYLLSHFGGPWVAFGVGSGGHNELASWDKKPSRSQLSLLSW